MARGSFESREDFTRARSKARMQSLLSALRWKNTTLLSFYEVTKLVKPRLETYRGVMPIKIDNIIGSEGRYHDFTLAFYPRKEMLRSRWQSVDEAHRKDIILPPISVYKLSDYYFVRDGNHRVSVAKTQGVEFIDAEVVELDSQIHLEPGMTKRELTKVVVEYERERVIEEYHLDKIIDMEIVKFSAPGMYAELINHILVHKYYLNQNKTEEISFEDAAVSWFREVFLPIFRQIKEDRLLQTFPGKTYGDLYMWIVRKWDDLKRTNKKEASIRHATTQVLESEHISLFVRIKQKIVKYFTEHSR
ncbi:MAG: transcriptional regulator [Spirochaetia bacterium]|nr:transcriptional regulator [Spirochaetia bacterium]